MVVHLAFRPIYFFLLLIAVGAAGFWLLGHLDPLHVLDRLAEAVVIAGILGASVELFARREFLRETAKDMIGYLIGYGLPPEIQNRLRETVTDTGLVRYNQEIRYRIRAHPERSGMVLVEMESSYETKNTSITWRKYTPQLGAEEADGPAFSEVVSEGKGRKAYSIPNPKPVIKPVGVLRVYGRTVRLRPGESITLRWKHSYVLPERYSETSAWLLPTIGVRVIADVEGFEFSVSPDKALQSSGNVHKYERLFMPGEHIRVRWWPKGVSA